MEIGEKTELSLLSLWLSTRNKVPSKQTHTHTPNICFVVLLGQVGDLEILIRRNHILTELVDAVVSVPVFAGAFSEHWLLPCNRTVQSRKITGGLIYVACRILV